ncbi:MAG: hypothetical protein N3B16_06170 [Candidatus Aminicenantes bacterium]|nr:hypothetical protein [Candidatus Aminicenantes bacterium]
MSEGGIHPKWYNIIPVPFQSLSEDQIIQIEGVAHSRRNQGSAASGRECAALPRRGGSGQSSSTTGRILRLTSSG